MSDTITTTVLSCEREDSRDGTKHWWIAATTAGRYKVWDKPVADAIISLTPLGPVELDVRPASDPKYLPSVTAVRPSAAVASAAAEALAPLGNGDAPSDSFPPTDSKLAIADAFRRASLAFKEIADDLDGIPF
jgi:hypothetical protein